jgi:hypothetical protein
MHHAALRSQIVALYLLAAYQQEDRRCHGADPVRRANCCGGSCSCCAESAASRRVDARRASRTRPQPSPIPSQGARTRSRLVTPPWARCAPRSPATRLPGPSPTVLPTLGSPRCARPWPPSDASPDGETARAKPGRRYWLARLVPSLPPRSPCSVSSCRPGRSPPPGARSFRW